MTDGYKGYVQGDRALVADELYWRGCEYLAKQDALSEYGVTYDAHQPAVKMLAYMFDSTADQIARTIRGIREDAAVYRALTQREEDDDE